MSGVFAHRPLLLSDRGLVSSGHHRASEAGAEMLRRGGNAMDAAIATAAALAVAVPNMNGLGGDAIGLYYDSRTHKVTAINGSGRSPAAATVEHFRGLGFDEIPQRGPLSMSVPGVVAAWGDALARWGTRSFAECLEFAIDLADAGTPLDVVQRDFYAGSLYAELADQFPPLTTVFGLPGEGRALGERVRQPALAETLRRLSREGPGSFYTGAIARALLADLKQAGSVLSPDDLHRHETLFAESIGVDYRGRTVHAAPPNSQGLALLLLLALSERSEPASGFDSPILDATDYMRYKKAAFALRDRYCVDPVRSQVPAELLSPASLDRIAATRVDGDAESRAGGGDTSTLVVVDREGNAVSWVQSLFEGFGSGVLSPQTGVVLHNRLYLERLDADPARGLMPGMRPFHTLCPAIVTAGEACEMAIATPGDHGQPQTLFQVLRLVYGAGFNIQQAIEQPRLRHDQGQAVMIESRADPVWGSAMGQAGYRAVDVGPWSRLMGGVNAVHRLHGNVWAAGADPRRAGYALTAGMVAESGA